MNFGFNSNVSVGNSVYHVQTEDRGPAHPYVDTVVYESGRVVYKVSTDYKNLDGGTTPDGRAQQLHDLLSKQHRDVISQLEAGTLDFRTNAVALADAVAIGSREALDVRLLNPKSWLNSGHVTLEVEMLRKGSSEPIDGVDIEAFLESDKNRTAPVRARSDPTGRATLRFPLPATVTEGAVLVIRAKDGFLYGELRFRLKARLQDKTPVEPTK